MHNTLATDDALAQYDLFLSKDRQHLLAKARFGGKACGHPQIIHGGAIASLLDDAMGTLFLSARLGNGFTANLNIDYRKPMAAGTPVVVEAGVDRVETARSGAAKVYITARIRDAEGHASPGVYAEATALFVVKAVPARGMLDKSAAGTVEAAPEVVAAGGAPAPASAPALQ